jgi:RNA-directed DNA polymerase
MKIELEKSSTQIREAFVNLKTREDIADLLEIDKLKLNFHLYVLPSRNKYSTFLISKKGGGEREITAPISPIKILQRKLNKALELVYMPKSCTHGFIINRSIITNARMHQKKRCVLNLDLKDFFPSIHFGRVRGLFMGIPYNLNQDVSTILAQICCHNGKLPQGAPTSPIVSNMVCAKLDSNLKQLARENQCSYTRYADDITFSSNRSGFPSSIACLSEIGQTEVGKELNDIIEKNGFKINSSKTRLQLRHQRQEVTGLIVNRYVNINRKYFKKLRAILYAWKKFGIESTTQNFFENHASFKYFGVEVDSVLFKKIIQGKIEFVGMVKGKTSRIFIDLQSKFYSLASELRTKRKYIYSKTIPVIYTEGKTDKNHLRAALNHFNAKGYYLDLKFEFPKKDVPIGGPKLFSKMEFEQDRPITNDRPHIFVFDRDDKVILNNLNQNDDYIERNNKVYSLVLPIPPHREDLPEICIEFYYSDKDIKTYDEEGRRLFISSEFDSYTGKHLKEELICKNINRFKGSTKIISEEVVDSTGNNVALTKRDFSSNILNKKKNFKDVDFSGFEPLFGKITEIISKFDSGIK